MMVSDIIRPDPFFTAGPADYEDVKARFLADGSTWAPQHAHDVEVLLTEVTRRALRDSGESFDAALGAKLGEAYGGRFVEHLEQLEAIVRDLATQMDDPVIDLDPEVMGDYVCLACPENDDDSPGMVHVREDFVHAGRCAWRRLTAWVPAHPVSGDQQ